MSPRNVFFCPNRPEIARRKNVTISTFGSKQKMQPGLVKGARHQFWASFHVSINKLSSCYCILFISYIYTMTDNYTIIWFPIHNTLKLFISYNRWKQNSDAICILSCTALCLYIVLNNLTFNKLYICPVLIKENEGTIVNYHPEHDCGRLATVLNVCYSRISFPGFFYPLICASVQRPVSYDVLHSKSRTPASWHSIFFLLLPESF